MLPPPKNLFRKCIKNQKITKNLKKSVDMLKNYLFLTHKMQLLISKFDITVTIMTFLKIRSNLIKTIYDIF